MCTAKTLTRTCAHARLYPCHFGPQITLTISGFRLRGPYADEMRWHESHKPILSGHSTSPLIYECENKFWPQVFSLPSDSEFGIFKAKILQRGSKFLRRRCHHVSKRAEEVPRNCRSEAVALRKSGSGFLKKKARACPGLG